MAEIGNTIGQVLATAFLVVTGVGLLYTLGEFILFIIRYATHKNKK